MDREKIKKIAVAAVICLAAFGVGYSVGYIAGIKHAIEVGLRFVDFELKPEARALIMSYIAGST